MSVLILRAHMSGTSERQGLQLRSRAPNPIMRSPRLSPLFYSKRSYLAHSLSVPLGTNGFDIYTFAINI